MSEQKIICGLDDIKELEKTPWAEVRPAKSTYELFSLAAKRWPDKTAMDFLPTGSPDDDPLSITCGQFFQKVTQAANMFNDLGVSPKDTVAILLPLLPQAQFALWGAEAAGIASPINFLLSAEQIAELLNASQAKVVVALGPHPMLDIWEKIESIRSSVSSLEAILVVGGPADEANGIYAFDETINKYPGDKLASGREFSPDDIASYFHTGGTTGSPKLAKHTHANEVYGAWACAQMWNLSEDEAILNGLPLFHVGGAILLSLSAISHGTRILMPSPGGLRTPAVVENIWRLVERHKLTIMGGIPTSHVAFNQIPVGDADLDLLKFGFTGGSATPVQIEKDMIEKMGCKMLHLYGATEASISITMTPAGSKGVIGSEGIRLPYEALKIVRLESLGSTPEECRPNESGVVLLKGPNVIPGYLDPSQNQGTLTHDGWLITGDLGHLNEDGFLFLTGRSKDLIIRSGHNIDPSIIEESAMQHPAIAMAAAVGKPDEYAGELPTLYVQLNPGATASPEGILEFLSENISERPALPKEVIIVEAIPTTAVGKIFKPELRWDIAKKHFSEQLSYLKDEGLDVCVEVGESTSLGRICKVTLSGKIRQDKASVEAEIAAKLGKYQYTQHEVVWELNH